MWTGTWLFGKYIDWIYKRFVVRKIIYYSILRHLSFFHLDIFDLFLTLSSFSLFRICTEQYRQEHLWILFGKIRQGIVRFNLRKICHSLCQIFFRKIYLFVWKIFRLFSAILPLISSPVLPFRCSHSFLFSTEFFCCSEEVMSELLSEY